MTTYCVSAAIMSFYLVYLYNQCYSIVNVFLYRIFRITLIWNLSSRHHYLKCLFSWYSVALYLTYPHMFRCMRKCLYGVALYSLCHFVYSNSNWLLSCNHSASLPRGYMLLDICSTMNINNTIKYCLTHRLALNGVESTWVIYSGIQHFIQRHIWWMYFGHQVLHLQMFYPKL